MAEKKKKSIKLKKTAAGAQQMGSTKDWEAIVKQFNKDMHKVHDGKMTKAEFKKKYGKSVTEAQPMLYAGAAAARARDAEKDPKYKDHKEDTAKYEKYWDKDAKKERKDAKALRDRVKSRTGATDYRKGGLTLNTTDKRKK
tara:strand:+ start:1943 stop:2365 length:423 start_codon:yes stop_codon:yes gene_type:complete